MIKKIKKVYLIYKNILICLYIYDIILKIFQKGVKNAKHRQNG